MSDHLLRFIPTDPSFVPLEPRVELARDLLERLVPDADEVTTSTTGEVEFIDQGGNFERVSCPLCGSEVAIEWWQERMEEAYAEKFSDLVVSMPCCGARSSLNDLDYQGPAGFSRFVLQALNPNVTDLQAEQVSQLSDILQTPLRRIWAHY